MSDIAGTACVVKVGDVASNPTSYFLIEGQADGSFNGGANTADTTAKDNGGWQTGFPTTISGEVTVSGNLRTERQHFNKLHQAWRGRSKYACQIVFDVAGEAYEGEFYVTALSINAPTQDVVKYDMTLTPANGLTHVPPT